MLRLKQSRLYHVTRVLLFAFALISSKACIIGGRKSVLPAVSSIFDYSLTWENETSIQLTITVPDAYRTENGAFDLVLSHSKNMTDVYYHQNKPYTGEETLTFTLPVSVVEGGDEVYWQIAWLPQNPMLSHQLITPYPMEIMITPSNMLQFIRPTDNDEVPADIVRFEIQRNTSETPTTVHIGVSRSSDFSTPLASHTEKNPSTTIQWKPTKTFPMGQLFAWTYFVQYDDTYARLSKPVKISFQATQPCSSRTGTRYAVEVIETHLTCLSKNHYTDATKALGPPDAHQLGEDSFSGIVSLGVDGWIIVQNGKCVNNGAGDDIRIYQVVSYEGVEVSVSENRNGPYISLGVRACGDYWSGGLANTCTFDLAGSGIERAAYIRIDDRIRVTHPWLGDCASQTVTTPGADIDAVEILH